ncbi:hypothetical protein KAR91_75540 [Candidatus Pacearchaeota archaeon]|nr:hypothetical protein [Candidatus Pacearchaeota archaeon]
MKLLVFTHGPNPLEQLRVNYHNGVFTTVKDVPFLVEILETLIRHGFDSESTVWANPKTLEMANNSELGSYSLVHLFSVEKGDGSSDLRQATGKIFGGPDS